MSERWPLPARSTPELLAQRIRSMSIASEHDDVLDCLLAIKEFLSLAKELKARMDERALEWVLENGDLALVIEPGKASPDDTRWYAGKERNVKLRHPGTPGVVAVFEDLLAAFGGDLEQVGECMVSEPYKQGTVKTLAGEELWSAHYKVEEPQAIKEGKPTAGQRKLVEERRAFARGRR